MAAANAVGTADCTGPWTTGAGRSCPPRRGADGFRRVLLGGQALSSPRVPAATPVFVRRFTDCGVPTRLRPDHGVPCATHTRARRSPLSAWWVRRGLRPAGSDPGQPPPNGRQARRQRTRQAAPTRPPAHTRRAQPETVDRFRQACPVDRPPEALVLPPPASRAAASPRPWLGPRPPREDPDRCDVRYGRANGGLRWKRQGVNGSIAGAGADVGLAASAAGGWHVDCGPLTRGRLLARPRRSAEASGRLKQHR
jgi:hypothetical protein